MQNPTWYNNQVNGCCNIAVWILLFRHSLTTCSMNMAVDFSWWFQQRCSSLFVHQAMNKPVNNTVQTGQLNHVQACQQVKTSCAFVYMCSKNNIIYLFYTIKIQMVYWRSCGMFRACMEKTIKASQLTRIWRHLWLYRLIYNGQQPMKMHTEITLLYNFCSLHAVTSSVIYYGTNARENVIYGWFSLTWPAAILEWGNNRKCLNKNRAKVP